MLALEMTPAHAMERAPEPVSVCLAAPFERASTADEKHITDLVDWLRTALTPFPKLLDALEQNTKEICLADNMFGAHGYLSFEEDRIVLSSDLPVGLLRAVTIHELRHAHQKNMGTCPSAVLSMQETARITLLLEADASAVSLAVAWGLRDEGRPEVWDALSIWSSHVDIVAAFEQEMSESGDVTLATGRAFSQWFASDWRREHYYLAACSDYLDREDETNSLRQYGLVGTDILDDLCVLPDGRSYRCEVPDYSRD